MRTTDFEVCLSTRQRLLLWHSQDFELFNPAPDTRVLVNLQALSPAGEMALFAPDLLEDLEAPPVEQLECSVLSSLGHSSSTHKIEGSPRTWFCILLSLHESWASSTPATLPTRQGLAQPESTASPLAAQRHLFAPYSALHPASRSLWVLVEGDSPHATQLALRTLGFLTPPPNHQ